MKVSALIIGLLIVFVSSTSYIKFREEVLCKKSCCSSTEKSNTNSSCCGDICSPFMKCQSSNVVHVTFQLPQYLPAFIEHHTQLGHFFTVQLFSELWRPPRV